MRQYTDDPVADYAAYEAEIEAAYAKLPECDNCGFHITDEYYYDINGQKLCLTCIEECRTYIE